MGDGINKSLLKTTNTNISEKEKLAGCRSEILALAQVNFTAAWEATSASAVSPQPTTWIEICAMLNLHTNVQCTFSPT